MLPPLSKGKGNGERYARSTHSGRRQLLRSRHDLRHRMVVRVCDEDVAAPIHRHTNGRRESAAKRFHGRVGRDHAANRNDLLHRAVRRNPPGAVVPAKPQPPVPKPPAAITAPADDPVEEHLARTRKQRLVDAAVVVGVVSIVVTVVVTLFSKEIHDWLVHAWARLLR
jgi:hypothetical protein